MYKENLTYKDQDIFFSSRREVEYLDNINTEKRRGAFEYELETAMQELLWVRGEAMIRTWDEGRIKDSVSGCFMDELVWKGGNSLEIKAFNRIEDALKNGEKLVVHFSPENESLDYGDNLVDFWINDKDKGEIKYLRCFVDDDFERFKELYEFFGGKEISSREEMLAKPLIVDKKFRMSDIQRNLKLGEKRIDVSFVRIQEVTRMIVDRFLSEYGDEIFEDEELIDRIYSGIQDTLHEDNREEEMIDIYMFGDIISRKETEKGGSCPGSNIVMEFAPGRGMIVEKVNGELVFREGSIDGLKECKACGYYYSGDSCPLCK